MIPSPATLGSMNADLLPALLHEVATAFAAQRVGDGSRMIERTLELDVSWELLTQAVRRGVEAGAAPR